MLKEMGFDKYAYDWRDRHLDEMGEELKLAQSNGIEVASVWMYITAGNDTIGQLSPSNERIFDILSESKVETTIWLGFGDNYFEGLSHQLSVEKGAEMVKYIYARALEMGCEIALYNHGGWYGDPNNQIEIIKTIGTDKIGLIYNFHHAHEHIDDFFNLAKNMMPYLSVVNLNGMKKGGPKIMTIGKGDQEKAMIKTLMDLGYEGPWGILGHIEEEDVKKVLSRNLEGLKSLLD
jgi:sugar phosphate isomerase/epimerase